MKKLLIAIVTVSMFITWLTYASNTKPLTPAQKRIQAIKLAKIKRQAKVKTGVVLPCNEINILVNKIDNLTGSYGVQYIAMSNYISEVSIVYNKYKDNQQCYSQARTLASNSQKYRDNLVNLKQLYRNELLSVQSWLETLLNTKKANLVKDTDIYDDCIEDNKIISWENTINGTNRPLLQCGKEPQVVIDEITKQLQDIKAKISTLNSN